MEIGIAALTTAIAFGVGLGVRLGGLNSDVKHLQDDVKWRRDIIAAPIIQKALQNGFTSYQSPYRITEAGEEKLPSDFKKSWKSLLKPKILKNV